MRVNTRRLFFLASLVTILSMKDKQIEKLIKAEVARQNKVINLIASENYASKDVLTALGSILTDKYGEGYPGRRYYRGTGVVDEVEWLAQERALQLFGLTDKSPSTGTRGNSISSNWSVNVQPLSGSPANFAVYAALVPAGGKIMGMSWE